MIGGIRRIEVGEAPSMTREAMTAPKTRMIPPMVASSMSVLHAPDGTQGDPAGARAGARLAGARLLGGGEHGGPGLRAG